MKTTRPGRYLNNPDLWDFSNRILYNKISGLINMKCFKWGLHYTSFGLIMSTRYSAFQSSPIYAIIQDH